MKKYYFIFLILSSGCMTLDANLFNNNALTSYDLPNTVIPDSMRTQVVMTSQGKKIYGYFIRSNGTNPQYTILYNHGNRDHLQFYWDRAGYLYQTGCNVFIYDYEGFGMSEGTPSEENFYSDARAAYSYIRSRSYVDSTNIIFYGFSLGCAAAIELAANTFTPKKLILEAPFANMDALVKSGSLLDIPSGYVMKGTYDNAEKIKHIHTPLLLMHGEGDTFIDIEKNGAVVFANANEPKKFIRVPGANHSEIPDKMGVHNYIDTVKTFILR